MSIGIGKATQNKRETMLRLPVEAAEEKRRRMTTGSIPPVDDLELKPEPDRPSVDDALDISELPMKEPGAKPGLKTIDWFTLLAPALGAGIGAIAGGGKGALRGLQVAAGALEGRQKGRQKRRERTEEKQERELIRTEAKNELEETRRRTDLDNLQEDFTGLLTRGLFDQGEKLIPRLEELDLSTTRNYSEEAVAARGKRKREETRQAAFDLIAIAERAESFEEIDSLQKSLGELLDLDDITKKRVESILRAREKGIIEKLDVGEKAKARMSIERIIDRGFRSELDLNKTIKDIKSSTVLDPDVKGLLVTEAEATREATKNNEALAKTQKQLADLKILEETHAKGIRALKLKDFKVASKLLGMSEEHLKRLRPDEYKEEILTALIAQEVPTLSVTRAKNQLDLLFTTENSARKQLIRDANQSADKFAQESIDRVTSGEETLDDEIEKIKVSETMSEPQKRALIIRLRAGVDLQQKIDDRRINSVIANIQYSLGFRTLSRGLFQGKPREEEIYEFVNQKLDEAVFKGPSEGGLTEKEAEEVRRRLLGAGQPIPAPAQAPAQTGTNIIPTPTPTPTPTPAPATQTGQPEFTII